MADGGMQQQMQRWWDCLNQILRRALSSNRVRHSLLPKAELQFYMIPERTHSIFPSRINSSWRPAPLCRAVLAVAIHTVHICPLWRALLLADAPVPFSLCLGEKTAFHIQQFSLPLPSQLKLWLLNGQHQFFSTWFLCGELTSPSLPAGAALKTTPPYRAGPTSSRQDDGTESPSTRQRWMCIYGQNMFCTAYHMLPLSDLLTATQETGFHLQAPQSSSLQQDKTEQCTWVPISAPVLIRVLRNQRPYEGPDGAVVAGSEVSFPSSCSQRVRALPSAAAPQCTQWWCSTACRSSGKESMMVSM